MKVELPTGVVVMGPGDNEAQCGVCKEIMPIPTPMPMAAFGPWCAYAEARHERCKPDLIPCASEADTTTQDGRAEEDGRATPDGRPG